MTEFTQIESARLRLRHFQDSDIMVFMGYRNDPVSCFLSYAFPTFDLHRVIAITDCVNIASVALLERPVMRREGHFIQNIWFKGKWGDEYLYAILKEEWLTQNHYGHII